MTGNIRLATKTEHIDLLALHNLKSKRKP
jgi:hypothetical protein